MAKRIEGPEVERLLLDEGKDFSQDPLDKNLKEAPPVISSAEKKLVKKINWAFVPLVCAILFVQFIDKSTLAYAGILGIYQDTGITHDQFALVGSMFYVGYLAVQLPNQYMLQRVRVSKYLGTILVLWGGSLLATAFCQNFAELAGMRFLLGFWEGTTYASIFLLISTLYRRREQVTWFGTMFITNASSTVFGGFITYGILYMNGLEHLSAWKWCMIIWGGITAILGLMVFFFLPDKPHSRWFRLTPEESKIVDERTLDNVVVQNKNIKMAHIIESLKELRLYCYFIISLLLSLQNGAITLFSAQIVNAMGFSRFDSVLLNIPTGVTIMIAIFIFMTLSKRYDEVCYFGALSALIATVGPSLLAAIPTGPIQLVGLYTCGFTAPSYVMLQTSISSNVSGYTKKIFYTAVNLVGYCIGNFIGPLMMVGKDAPRYFGAMGGYASANLVVALLYLLVRWTLTNENRRRRKMKEEGKMPPVPEKREELDLTDKEDMNFLYRP